MKSNLVMLTTSLACGAGMWELVHCHGFSLTTWRLCAGEHGTPFHHGWHHLMWNAAHDVPLITMGALRLQAMQGFACMPGLVTFQKHSWKFKVCLPNLSGGTD
jgi:hypothetical protein